MLYKYLKANMKVVFSIFARVLCVAIPFARLVLKM